MSDHTNGYLIDASNLHRGGGVQVAASLISELFRLESGDSTEAREARRISYLVSDEVYSNLHLDSPTGATSRILRGNSGRGRWVKMPERGFEAVFTVFGPTYRRRIAPRELVGFALPRMIYPLEEVRLQPQPMEGIWNRLRWASFSRADVLVVETHDAARRLAEHLPHSRVRVVPNCVSNALVDRASWRVPSRLTALTQHDFVFAAVARDYPHKNLSILPQIGEQLRLSGAREVRFAVTLSEEEWERRPPQFRAWTVNLGVLNQNELGPVYQACDAALLPSLLEVSSATPMEAAFFGLPLFAADVPFARAAYGDNAVFFDPWNAAATARQIGPCLEEGHMVKLGAKSRAWSAGFPTPMERARSVLDALVEDGDSF